MNISVKTVLSIAFVAALQFAASASHAQGSLIVRCAPLHLPTQQDVGRALGLSNFAQIYSAREKLMRTLNHACLSGTQQVTFITEPTRSMQANGASRIADTTRHTTPPRTR